VFHRASGIRSLKFKTPALLSYGTGQGSLVFLDLRMLGQQHSVHQQHAQMVSPRRQHQQQAAAAQLAAQQLAQQHLQAQQQHLQAQQQQLLQAQQLAQQQLAQHLQQHHHQQQQQQHPQPQLTQHQQQQLLLMEEHQVQQRLQQLMRGGLQPPQLRGAPAPAVPAAAQGLASAPPASGSGSVLWEPPKLSTLELSRGLISIDDTYR
jgi:hypothetical protein